MPPFEEAVATSKILAIPRRKIQSSRSHVDPWISSHQRTTTYPAVFRKSETRKNLNHKIKASVKISDSDKHVVVITEEACKG